MSGNKKTYDEAEGFSLTDDIYHHISKKPLSFITETQSSLTIPQSNELLSRIKNGEYFLYKTIYNIENNIDPDQNKQLESSDEIHMNIVTYYVDASGNKVYISVGQFTSSKEGTVVISPKQYINLDPTETNKEQRFRSYTQFVKVPIEKVKEFEYGTAFATSTNYQGLNLNIQEKIINAVLTKESFLRQNTVREYHLFTRESLLEIAKSFTSDNLDTKRKALRIYEHNLTTAKMEKAENQNKNEIRNELVKELSPEYKNMRTRLEEHVKKENKNK